MDSTTNPENNLMKIRENGQNTRKNKGILKMQTTAPKQTLEPQYTVPSCRAAGTIEAMLQAGRMQHGAAAGVSACCTICNKPSKSHAPNAQLTLASLVRTTALSSSRCLGLTSMTAWQAGPATVTLSPSASRDARGWRAAERPQQSATHSSQPGPQHAGQEQGPAGCICRT